MAWHDQRGSFGEIYGARVSAAGELLDPTGIRLSTDDGFPAVTFAGGAYAVFWEAQTVAGTMLEVVRVSVDGQIIDGPRAMISDPNGFRPAVASNGRTIVVVTGSRLLLLDDHATLLETVPVLIDPDTASIATNGSTFLLAWRKSNAEPITMIMPLDATGHPSAPPRAAGPYQYYPKIGSDGRDFLMAVGEPPNMITITPISAAGEPSAPRTLAEPAMSLDGVAWNGSEYLILFQPVRTGTQSIEAVRVDRSGTSISGASDTVAQALGFESPVVLSSAGRIAMFAEEQIGSDDDVRGHLIEGTNVTNLLVSQSASGQLAPLVASSGNGVIATWIDSSLPYANLYSNDGTPRLANPIRLPIRLPLAPKAVVFDGANYVLFGALHYGATAGAYAVRVAPDTGALLDPVPIHVNDDYVSAAAAGSGSTAIVTTSLQGVHLTRLDRALAVGKSALIAPLYPPYPPDSGEAAVAWDGTEWLVAFGRITASPIVEMPNSEIVAVRASADLDVLDATPIELGASLVSHRPRVVSNGKEFAVFWSDNWGYPFTAKARRVSRDGNALGEAVTISSASGLSDALWDGARYAVALDGVDAREQTYVTHLASDLTPAGDVLLLAPGDASRLPRLTQMSAGLVAVYLRRAFEPAYGGVFRAFLRTPMWLRPRPVGR